MDRLLKLRYICCIIIIMIILSGYTFPDGAPHIHIINNGVTYDIYFAGTNFRDALIYDTDTTSIINTYSSSITGYLTINGVNRTASFPVYDYGNIRINDTMPASYIYLNQVTSCEFINMSEAAFWKHDLTNYLLAALCIIVFMTFIKR